MPFLANENFPGAAVAALREAGHDVSWVRADAPGINDETVLAWAVSEERVLLTFDKDFGEFAWRARLPAGSGIMLFRLPMPDAQEVGALLAARIGERTDWMGHFTLIEPARVRMRALSGQGAKPT
jgi:predicted nuclease of predicted toxin-antitoxin system